MKRFIVAFIAIISIILLAVCSTACIIIAFLTLNHAVKNPDLTFTRNLIWMWDRYKGWIIVGVVDYLCLPIIKILLENAKKW